MKLNNHSLQTNINQQASQEPEHHIVVKNTRSKEMNLENEINEYCTAIITNYVKKRFNVEIFNVEDVSDEDLFDYLGSNNDIPGVVYEGTIYRGTTPAVRNCKSRKITKLHEILSDDEHPLYNFTLAEIVNKSKEIDKEEMDKLIAMLTFNLKT